MVNNGPSAVGATIIKSYWPRRIDSGDVLVNITDVTMDTGDECIITSVINNQAQNDVRIPNYFVLKRFKRAK